MIRLVQLVAAIVRTLGAAAARDTSRSAAAPDPSPPAAAFHYYRT